MLLCCWRVSNFSQVEHRCVSPMEWNLVPELRLLSPSPLDPTSPHPQLQGTFAVGNPDDRPWLIPIEAILCPIEAINIY